MKFDKDPWGVEQKKYLTKIVNVYIAYDLDAWSRNPINDFNFKNWLFGATKTVKNRDKEKYVYSGYGITFDGNGFWSFDNDTARNVKIEALVHQKKKNSINFTEADAIFCLSLHYNADNSYLIVNKKEIFKFKADNKNVNLPTQFWFGSISNGFSTTESREVSLKRNVYGFSVEYISVNKSQKLNTHKYLMTKNNMK